MNKIKLSLLALAAIVFSMSASAQTLTFDFSVLDATSTVLGSGSNTVTPSQTYPYVPTATEITIDLRSAGVCAGDQVFLENNSSGWIYSNIPANTLSSSTGWALHRGNHSGGFNFNFCGSYIFGAPQGGPLPWVDPWNPNPVGITIPDVSAACNEDVNTTNGHHTVCYLASPDVYYYGAISEAACESVIEIRLIVNSRPECLSDLELCPSMKEPYIQDAIEDHIPSNLIAYDWTPFDPRTTSFVTNTNFTVWLENANGTGCARECNFDITWAQPTHQIIQNGSICEDQAPYLGISVDNLAVSNTTLLLINGVEVYPNPTNSSIFDDYFGTYDQLALTEPGLYTIQQEFLMADGSTCSKEYEVTIYEVPGHLSQTYYEFCEGYYQEICGSSPTASGQNYNYTWSYHDVNQGTMILVSNDQCFTPSQPGTYTLYTTNGTCSSFETITVVEINTPVISVPDKVWCKKVPVFVSPQQSFNGSISHYSWTYNGNSLSYTGWNIPYQGDGTYCITVHWENGCQSSDCFQVYRDCAPLPKSNFSTSPNPTKGTVQMKFNSSGQKEIIVRTINGQVLMTKKTVDTDRTSIDLSAYPKGIYFIEVSDSEGTSVEKVRVQ
ncbi:MAG: T9SS type A sorting domain-containing protein [Crocinitomicaceae bacterium]|nr:T9SS type A sorting domain-containing protein [Crocinitomicaceae bacterium]